MSRALVLQHGSTNLEFGLEKIDRRKLYGFVDTEAVDTAGRPCELALLGSDGRTIVGRGGSALLWLDPDGNHVEKQSLKPIKHSGESWSRVPSSFDAPIALSVKASVEDLLNHNVKATYALTAPMGATALIEELRQGVIYSFPFSYRGGLDPDVAFLMVNPDGLPFLLLGKPTSLEFVGLAEETATESEEAPETDEDSDDVDFAMM
jgi:hypothetical protein